LASPWRVSILIVVLLRVVPVVDLARSRRPGMIVVRWRRVISLAAVMAAAAAAAAAVTKALAAIVAAVELAASVAMGAMGAVVGSVT
jgi:hypothetical protein